MNCLQRLNGRLTLLAAGDPDLEFERQLRAKAPRSLDALEWAHYNQWVSEQRTLNQKESKP